MISVVVPVYNSRATLCELVNRLAAVLSGVADSFEVILVNDGSRDGSWPKIVELVQERHFVRGLDLRQNYGQHVALLAGIRAARGNIIVTMDDDMQFPPEEIPRLLSALTDDVDLAYGRPRTLMHSPWRNLTSRFARSWLKNVMGVKTAKHFSAFRAFRSGPHSSFNQTQDPFLFVDALLARATSRFASVLVDHQPRRGRSSYSFVKLVVFTLNMIISFSIVGEVAARLSKRPTDFVRQEIP